MLRTGKLLALIFVAFVLGAQAGAPEADIENPSEVRDKYLVILCAEREFDSVKDEAEKVSIASGVEFSMSGRVWDSRRGLILPDECGDPIYCGEYLPRRYNELHLMPTNPGYISVEKSEAYPRLQEGYYIALGAICDSNEEAERELLKFKSFAPKAYVAKTEIYMGCIH
jgi:hypothetical protein